MEVIRGRRRASYHLARIIDAEGLMGDTSGDNELREPPIREDKGVARLAGLSGLPRPAKPPTI